MRGVLNRRTMVAAILAFTVGAERGESWFERTATGRARRFEDPVHRLTVEYPNDWRLLVGGEAALFTLVSKNGEALMMLERASLEVTLLPEDVAELFVDLELELAQALSPTATGLRATVVDRDKRRMIIIDFQRDAAGRLERVRHYVYPVGREVYRFVCSAPVLQFDKYGKVFSTVSASLTFGTDRRADDNAENAVPSSNRP
jgi:hypothetical protein